MQSLQFIENEDYELETVRGPQLRFPAHNETCTLSDLRAYHRDYSSQPLAVDLFSGGGGLSLGLQRAGFRLVLAVDNNAFAVETHSAYFPGASIKADISTEDRLDELLEPLRGKRIDLLVGGPPCQPFSKPARWMRSAYLEGHGSLRDHRRELWRSFLYAAEILKPKAILIENVTDIATNEDAIILRGIFSKMEKLGYSVDCRTYFACDFGVAQYRQRIFVVGFKNGKRLLEWPAALPKKKRATVRDAISDLPPLQGGWNELAPAYRGPVTDLQKRLRDGIKGNSLFDHATRGVRGDDLVAFRLMTNKTRYDQLPEELRRYGATSFTDKYNRLAWDEPGRTIAAHIAKDGYWYIHPDQHRSLSIREAARIQSFPDWFRFAGFRTSALKQIGEAVSPFVAEAIGRKILKFLGPDTIGGTRLKLRFVDKHLAARKTLKTWYKGQAKKNTVHPWRREPTLWAILLGELLFSGKGQERKAALFWKNYHNDWPDPKTFLKDKHRESHTRTIGMGDSAPALEALARYLMRTKSPAVEALASLGINERIARRAMAIAGLTLERPNDTALVRVARRVFERAASDQRSSVEDQIATALLVGEDDGATLYAAAIELGETLCSAIEPACMLCPIREFCSHAGQN